MRKSLCRHCGAAPISRPRGLCWSCYNTPDISGRYRTESVFGQRGVPDFEGEAPLPLPTDWPPGSPEYLAILEARASRGQALFHRCDATWEDFRRLEAEIQAEDAGAGQSAA
jgi:hypothetical protein